MNSFLCADLHAFQQSAICVQGNNLVVAARIFRFRIALRLQNPATGERRGLRRLRRPPVLCAPSAPLSNRTAGTPDQDGFERSESAVLGMDGYADDLAAVIEALDLKNVTLIGHSTGGGEVARYIGRHGGKRVAGAVLIAAVPPFLLKTAANPEGLPMEVFNGIRAGLAADRSQFYKHLAVAFYGANRPGAKVSPGILEQFWLWSMQAGALNAYDCIKAFSETNFTEDLRKFDFPTLVLHGEDDQIVPVKDSAKKSAKLIKGAKEIYYPGAPHGLTATHQEQVNADLLEFLQSVYKSRKAA